MLELKETEMSDGTGDDLAVHSRRLPYIFWLQALILTKVYQSVSDHVQVVGDDCDVLTLSCLFWFLLLLQKKHQQRCLQLPGEQAVEMALMKMVEVFWQGWVLEMRCVLMQATNPNPNWMNYLAKMRLSVKVNFILSVLHNCDECSCFYIM